MTKDKRGGKREGAGRKPQTYLEMYCQGWLAAKVQANDELWINIIRRYRDYPAPLIVISGMAILFGVRTMRGVAKQLKVRVWSEEYGEYRDQPMDWQRLQTYMRAAGYRRVNYYSKGEAPEFEPIPKPPTGLADLEDAADLFDIHENELRIGHRFDPDPTDLLDYRKKGKR